MIRPFTEFNMCKYIRVYFDGDGRRISAYSLNANANNLSSLEMQ